MDCCNIEFKVKWSGLLSVNSRKTKAWAVSYIDQTYKSRLTPAFMASRWYFDATPTACKNTCLDMPPWKMVWIITIPENAALHGLAVEDRGHCYIHQADWSYMHIVIRFKFSWMASGKIFTPCPFILWFWVVKTP
ncbi:hypothetical protein K449DRAFT_432736 [Hypoxylon sp. EC38]|nr:hypothetical protein K449DRAFT_432736 [Hypoxylon sp. EC38]